MFWPITRPCSGYPPHISVPPCLYLHHALHEFLMVIGYTLCFFWCFSVLQADSELTSSYLAQRQQAFHRVEELQHRTAQLPTLFPWPGTAERRQICLLARQLQDETESLQLTLTSLAEQRRELAEQTSDTIWTDSSSAELETLWSSLMSELKVKPFNVQVIIVV